MKGTEYKERIGHLKTKKLLFGHQSVGYNLIKGINQIEKEAGVSLNIIELRKIDPGRSPAFFHFRVGQNKDALSKIDDFKSVIEENAKEKPDIAFFKFCYIDFKRNTDVDHVFKVYSETMDTLKKEHPGILFIHMTVPLRAVQKGLKAMVKKILGKSTGYEDNLARNRFNRLLLKKYSGTDKIFDIAGYESTYRNGKRKMKIIQGEECYSMIPGYTYDGGHLTATGEKVLGERLISFLSELN